MAEAQIDPTAPTVVHVSFSWVTRDATYAVKRTYEVRATIPVIDVEWALADPMRLRFVLGDVMRKDFARQLVPVLEDTTVEEVAAELRKLCPPAVPVGDCPAYMAPQASVGEKSE